MQQIIDAQNAKIEELQEQIYKMTQIPDEIIKESRLYQELQRENRSLKGDNDFYRTFVKTEEAGTARRKAQIEKLRKKCNSLLKDNQRLSEEHERVYWVGVSEEPASIVKRLEKENTDLRDRCAAIEEKYVSADKYAKHLENKLNELLYELRPEEKPVPNPEKEPARSRRVGRPRKATRSQISEARQWRRDGLSIREIARRTEELWGKENAWSVSYVQKMVGNIECLNKKKQT